MEKVKKFAVPLSSPAALAVGYCGGRAHLRYQLKQKMQAVADQRGTDLKAAFKARSEKLHKEVADR